MSPLVWRFLVIAVLSRVASSLVEDTLEVTFNEDRTPTLGRPKVRSLTSAPTLIVTGELNVLVWSPFSPPLTVMYSLNVTGVSNVVTRFPIASSSSSDAASDADSRNISSPVMASILRLPMYRSPLELRPV